MDVREKYVMQKVNRKEKSICPNCIHHNLCIAENNQPCFECNRFIDAHGVTAQEEAKLYWKPVNPGEWILTCSACDSHLGCREGTKHCPECGAKFVYPKAFMSQRPKGE